MDFTEFTYRDAEKRMEEALQEAAIAGNAGEIPVGSLLLDREGRVVGRGHNDSEGTRKIHGHAEINAINDAAQNLGTLKLSGCTLFVTLEPCPMCAGAIAAAGIETVVYGAASPDSGAAGSVCNLLYPRVKAFGGIREEECTRLLRSFFRDLREK